MDALTTTRYLPRSVKTYLGSAEVTDINIDIKKKFDLRERELDILFELTWDILEGRRAPRALAYELKAQIKWQEKKAAEVALEILGRKLLPLSNLIPGIPEAIKDLGADPAKYPQKKITSDQTTLPVFVDEMIRDLGIQLADKFLKHRLENVAEAKIKGVRDDFETKERMVRGIKIGGLELAPTQADQIIAYIESAKKTIQIVDRPSAPTAVGGTAPAVAIPLSRMPAESEVPEEITRHETGTAAPFAMRPEDVAEIHAERGREISDAVLPEYERVDKDIIKDSGFSFSDPDMQKRFENTVRARVRDVRDELETKNILTRGPKEGGLGLPKEKSDRLIALINQKVGPLRLKLAKIEEQKKAEHLVREKRNREIGREREEENLNRRYAKLTGRMPSSMPSEEKKPERTLPLKDHIIKPSAPVIKPVAQVSVVTAVIPQEPGLPMTIVPVPIAIGTPVRPASRPESLKPKVRVSPPSIPAQTSQTGRPRVEEIKFSRRLFGPIEELREMKFEDFRRLSREPRERAIKIKDKIDLLGEESFEKKMQGIAAWQESPINKLYLNLIQEAFQTGKNIETITREREAAGRSTLSWDEFQSIIELNQNLGKI
ncbi:MAG: hypothetical protein PHW53_02395 [Patescibacteria group bacterium]|nr:hypothetical protein [Patescibacteria group bacterium]